MGGVWLKLGIPLQVDIGVIHGFGFWVYLGGFSKIRGTFLGVPVLRIWVSKLGLQAAKLRVGAPGLLLGGTTLLRSV